MSIKVLIFDNNEFLSDLYQQNLRVYANCDCITVRDLRDAYLQIQKDETIELLVVKEFIGDTSAAKINDKLFRKTR